MGLSVRVVNARNGLLGKVVVVVGMDKFKWDLNRYLDALEIERYGDIGLCAR